MLKFVLWPYYIASDVYKLYQAARVTFALADELIRAMEEDEFWEGYW